eukprot:3148285-Prymnesium_polylepis.1
MKTNSAQREREKRRAKPDGPTRHSRTGFTASPSTLPPARRKAFEKHHASCSCGMRTGVSVARGQPWLSDVQVSASGAQMERRETCERMNARVCDTVRDFE